MTLTQVRIEHKAWTITKETNGRLHCQHGAFRFTAKTPDEAHKGIVLRETPQRFSEPAPEGLTFGELSDELAKPGF